MSEQEQAVESPTDTDNTEVIFDETMDITMVLTYHEKLNELLNNKKKIHFNAEKVNRIDGAGIQLLVAFFIAAEKLNLDIAWTGVSEEFEKNVKILGLSEQIGI